jgi:hypothetical protein
LIDVQFYKRKVLRGQTSRSGKTGIPKSPSFQLPSGKNRSPTSHTQASSAGEVHVYNPPALIRLSCSALVDSYNSCSIYETRLVVGRGLATVANKLESANHLTNGEEAEDLSRNNTASGELGRADIPHLLDSVLRRLDNGAVLDGLDDVLVGVLEGGQVTVGYALAGYPATSKKRLLRGTHGGLIFWFWKTNLPTSRATLE